jgi:hypothetical protein
MVYIFDMNGKCLERSGWDPRGVYPRPAFEVNHGAEVIIWDSEIDPHPDVPLNLLRGLIMDGVVTGIELDPSWQPTDPPAPPVDPVQTRLDELAAKVDRLPVGTIHETRQRDQKEWMKLWAIPWVKAHPEATPVDAALAIMAALRAEFPADPICTLIYEKDPLTGREDGLLMSYADSAHTAGLTPDKSWQSLRELIVNTPEQMLRDALRKL